MKNPSEELVTAWLQECKNYFTMNNIKVPKKGGGMGAEIDILATNVENNIWVEVSVSTNPRQNYLKHERLSKTVQEVVDDFEREDKNQKAKEIFLNKSFEKWFVHGIIPLPKKEIDEFPVLLKQKGIISIYFGEVLKGLFELKYYRLDSARGYLNLFKTFIKSDFA